MAVPGLPSDSSLAHQPLAVHATITSRPATEAPIPAATLPPLNTAALHSTLLPPVPLTIATHAQTAQSTQHVPAGSLPYQPAVAASSGASLGFPPSTLLAVGTVADTVVLPEAMSTVSTALQQRSAHMLLPILPLPVQQQGPSAG